MRKSLLASLLTVATAGSAIAATLSPDEALARLSGPQGSRMAPRVATAHPRLITTGTDSDGLTTYYVFATSSQTLFVAADDVAQPLLGYIDNPDFNVNDMPPAMKWWLGEYSREIAWASANGTASSAPRLVRKGASVKSTSRQPISPLVTTTWNQGAPYNNLCPMDGSSRSVTGCVATAMAQVMNYHKWPAQGTGVASYTWNNQTLTMDMGATTFDWNNMLPTYASSTSGTVAQRNAVATLMKACGYSVSMDYSASESGAYSENLRGALVDYFNYDKATRFEYRDYYALDEWEQMIYESLSTCGPVLYSGSGSMGGHCFVCDGYNASGLFHINWGWGGTSDGYFALTALNPSVLGTGGGAGGFNYNQDVVLGIRKPQSGSEAPKPYIYSPGSLTASASGRAVTLSAGDQNGFFNMGPDSGSFTFGLMLVSDSNGAVTYLTGSITNRTLAANHGTRSYSANIPTSVANGTYKAYPVYQVDGGDWNKIKLYYYNPQYVTLTVSASGVTVANQAAGGVTVSDITIVEGLKSESAYKVTARLTSTYTAQVSKTIVPYLCYVEDGEYYIEGEMDAQTVDLPANGAVTATFSGTLAEMAAADDYTLVFVDGDDNHILGELYPVEVTSDGAVSVSAFGVDPNPIQIGKRSVVTVRLDSTFPETKSINVWTVLCTEDEDTYQFTPIASYGVKAVSIPANSSAIATFSGTVPTSLQPGEYAIVFVNDSSGKVMSYGYVNVVSASSIGDISVDGIDAAGAEWFDIQGRKVGAGQLATGVYVRRSADGKSTKVLVK